MFVFVASLGDEHSGGRANPARALSGTLAGVENSDGAKDSTVRTSPNFSLVAGVALIRGGYYTSPQLVLADAASRRASQVIIQADHR